jgi:hypothetical protein
MAPQPTKERQLMAVVELLRIRVDPPSREAFLSARPRMLRDYAADREGFIGAHLIELGGDDWLDLIIWRNCADLEESRAKGVNLPGIRAYAQSIAGILADEQGEMLEFELPIGPHPWRPEMPPGVPVSMTAGGERR